MLKAEVIQCHSGIGLPICWKDSSGILKPPDRTEEIETIAKRTLECPLVWIDPFLDENDH